MIKFLSTGYLFVFALSIQAQIMEYDIVLRNGRVIDPETGLDAVRNIGIKGNRIAEITSQELKGKEVLDVSGMVVSPGFIDIHAHGQTNKENEYQVHDGVTTALELEWGQPSLSKFLSERKSKAIINYGASACQPCARNQAITRQVNADEMRAIDSGNKLNNQSLKDDEMQPMLNNMMEALDAGAIGFGVPVGYTPGATREEIFNVYEFAAKQKVPIFTHVREGKALAIQQAIADAAVNGTSLHIVHLNSMTLSEIGLALRMVEHAQQLGMDITTELYPYTAASTSIESAIFNEGWQTNFGMTYSDLQLASTGERLTEETFKSNREKGGVVIMHFMKEEWIQKGLRSPLTMVASDGMPYSRFAHPRSAGTFSRLLGVYVREQKLLTLNEALRKITLMPAQRLESISPAMRFKGRLQVGADADVTIFDANTIIDKATFDGGLKFSEGIKHVMVNGTFVVKNGLTLGNIFPGQPVYGKYKR